MAARLHAHWNRNRSAEHTRGTSVSLWSAQSGAGVHSHDHVPHAAAAGSAGRPVSRLAAGPQVPSGGVTGATGGASLSDQQTAPASKRGDSSTLPVKGKGARRRRQAFHDRRDCDIRTARSAVGDQGVGRHVGPGRWVRRGTLPGAPDRGRGGAQLWAPARVPATGAAWVGRLAEMLNIARRGGPKPLRPSIAAHGRRPRRRR